MVPDPFFIIGNPRSGTTMFRLMLTSHKTIYVPTESGWALHLSSKYQKHNDIDVDAFLADLQQCKKIEYWDIDYVDLKNYLKGRNKHYRQISASVYQYCATKYGKVIYGDKNNNYLNHVEDLSQIYPESKFIHLVRDGRDVACSYRNLQKLEKGKYFPDLPSSVIDCAYEWVKNIETIQNSLSKLKKDQYLEIRFEDLVNNTERALAKVCTFLEQDYDDNMLKFYLKNRDEGLEPEDLMKWKQDTSKPIDTSQTGKWKHNFFAEDKLFFQTIASHTLKEYGYEIDDNLNKSMITKRIQDLIDLK